MALMFERDFDAELAQEDRQARHAARARHTPEELNEAVEAARTAGFIEGKSIGRAQGLAEAETADGARRAVALEALGQQIPAMVQENDRHRAALETQMLDFALTVCEQVFPELLRRRAHDRALAQVRRALAVGLGSVSLQVSLSSDGLQLLKDDLDTAINQHGLEGRVKLRADPMLADGDARVDWDNGFLEYSFSSICDRILCALREARSATHPTLSER